MTSSSRLSNQQKLLYDVKLNRLKINDNRIDFLKKSEIYSDSDIYRYPSISVGYECLKKVPKSDGGNLGNVAYGVKCLLNNETGIYNCALGLNCLALNKNGSANVALGSSALLYNINGNNNTAVGNNAGINIGNNEKAISECSSNVAIGNNAMTGYYTNLCQCVAIGSLALGDNLSKLNTDILIENNIAIGYATSYSSNGSFNSCIGAFSNYNNTGSNNIMFGYDTLYSTTPFNTEDSTYIGNYILPIDEIKNEIVLNSSIKIDNSIRGSNTMILGNNDSNNIHMPGLISNNDPKFSQLKKGSLYYEEDTGVVKVKLG